MGGDRTPLNQLLTPVEDPVVIEDDVRYRQVTVAINGKGLRLRSTSEGRAIDTKRQFRVSRGHLVISRIDARNGAVGIVPPELDGAIVTGDFPCYSIDQSQMEPRFLEHFITRVNFARECAELSRGVTNRQRLNEDVFLTMMVPCPSLREQRRVLSRIEALSDRISEARSLRSSADTEYEALMRREVESVAARSAREPMKEVAPIIRRWVDPIATASYPELGLRSFGKGTFHKPAIKGADLNGKRMVEIHPGDLLFSNVFAWEGAIAVAELGDAGRYGSHRYITCVPDPDRTTSNFLRNFFLTEEGMALVRDASPGAAGRNRTLGVKKLEAIPVPVLTREDRAEFEHVATLVDRARREADSTRSDFETLMPSILDAAFSGRL